MPFLVAIVGPIASGKSTVAATLTARLRQCGRQVADLDLDDAVVASGPWADATPERLRKATIVFGRMVGVWLEQGFDVVAHGPFFEPFALEDLLGGVHEGTEVRLVRLIATYEAALQRVSSDPARKLSKDAEFLRHAYGRSRPLLAALPAMNWEFDTTVTPLNEIVEDLTAALLS